LSHEQFSYELVGHMIKQIQTRAIYCFNNVFYYGRRKSDGCV